MDASLDKGLAEEYYNHGCFICLLILPLDLAADVDETHKRILVVSNRRLEMAKYILMWLFLQTGGNYELIIGRNSAPGLPSPGIVLCIPTDIQRRR